LAYHPRFAVDNIGEEHPNAVEMALRSMGHLLTALVAIDVDFLRAFPRTPLLYQSGVVYDRMQDEVDACGDDAWADIPHVLAATRGDCEDLACWRVAELRVRFGVAATVAVLFQPGGDGVTRPRHLYHILVRWPEGLAGYPAGVYRKTLADGTTMLLECPSTALGMPAAAA